MRATPERLRLLGIAWREGRNPRHPEGCPQIPRYQPQLPEFTAEDREHWLAGVRDRLGLVTASDNEPG